MQMNILIKTLSMRQLYTNCNWRVGNQKDVKYSLFLIIWDFGTQQNSYL